MGRKSRRGPVDAFRSLLPGQDWSFAGWIHVGTAFLTLSFYCVVAGWGVHYLFMALTHAFDGRSHQEISSLFHVLYRSSDLNIFWQSIFCLMTCSVVYAGVLEGVERWSRVFTPGLFVFLLILVVYGFHLEGFWPAVNYLFVPNWGQVTSGSVMEALGMSFFTLSVGIGIIITYGSYLGKRESAVRVSGLVAFMTILVSTMAALAIFPATFTFGVPPSSGPGLVFCTLTPLFSQMWGGGILSVIFFSLLVFTALTSSISLLEEIVATLIERYSWSRSYSVALAGLGSFILGIPSACAGSGGIFPEWQQVYGVDFFETVSMLVSDWLFPLGALCIAIFVGWMAPSHLWGDQFEDARLFAVWRWLVRWVCPIAIGVVFLQGTGS